MPITSSGQIALIADIEAEFDQTGTTDISLQQARDDAGLGSGQISMTQFYSASDSTAPSVSTDGVNSVNYQQMRVYGNVSSDGGATVTQKGFYFGTSSNYTSNTKYSVSSGTGSFNRTFTGLSGSATYYRTAYAINSVGETVGSTVSQSTSATPNFINGYWTSGGGGSAGANIGPFSGVLYFGSWYANAYATTGVQIAPHGSYMCGNTAGCFTNVSYYTSNCISCPQAIYASGTHFGASGQAYFNGSGTYTRGSGTKAYASSYAPGNNVMNLSGSAPTTFSIS